MWPERNHLLPFLLLFAVTSLTDRCSGAGEAERRLRDAVDGIIKQLLPHLIRSTGDGPSVSIECMSAIFKTISGIRELHAWAFQMLDASGKLPSGLLEGTTTSLGSFDQCLELSLPNGDKGQYCTLMINPMPSLFNETRSQPSRNVSPESQTILDVVSSQMVDASAARLRIGLCTPARCSIEDLNTIASQSSKALHVDASVIRCETKQPLVLDIPSQVVIVFTSLVAVLVLSGTVSHYLCRSKRRKPKKGKTTNGCLRFMSSFSLLSNLEAFLNVEPEVNEKQAGLSCLSGIRFLSAAWNVLGNVFFLPSVVEFANFRSRVMVPNNERQFLHSALSNSTLSYEAFFFVSGLLATATCLQKGATFKQAIRSIISDWLRWTAISGSLTAIVLLCSELGSGPFYGDIVTLGREVCLSNWWGNFIHVANFWHPKYICLIHNWFLSAVLQIQLLCMPLILFPILRGWRRLAFISGILLLTGSLLSTGLLTWVLDLAPGMDGVTTDYRGRVTELVGQVLIKPYTHLAIYVVGVFAALAGHLWGQKSIPRLIRWLGWLTCLVCWFGTVYGLHGHRNGIPLDRSVRALYASLHRTVFSLALAWVFVICKTGQASLLCSFLSWKVLKCLDRLSPGIFCLGPIVIMGHLSSLRENQFFGYEAMVHQFLSVLCITCILSFLLHLFVEAPITSLLNWIWPVTTPNPPEECQSTIRKLSSTSVSSKKDQEQTVIKVPLKEMPSKGDLHS